MKVYALVEYDGDGAGKTTGIYSTLETGEAAARARYAKELGPHDLECQLWPIELDAPPESPYARDLIDVRGRQSLGPSLYRGEL